MYSDELVLELISAGPLYSLDGAVLGPDEVIAIEGIGTFKGVNIRERVSDALSSGAELSRLAAKVHKESTRRGHASLSTSAVVFWEVSNCSRLTSMLLVAPVFGSFLQESQRRAPLVRERLLTPAELRGGPLEERYSRAMDRCFEAYRALCGLGVEIEDARYVLPLSAATSLFAALPLESHVYLIRKVSDTLGLVTEELRALVERLLKVLSATAPKLLESRLSFKSRWSYYAVTDPLRPPDGLMQRLAGDRPETESELLSIDCPGGFETLNLDRVEAEQASPLLRAVTVESLSLAAYHQAIRHRTVPTVVESIVEAAERWTREPEKSIVTPPSIKSRQNTFKVFTEACGELLDVHQRLVSENMLEAALYSLPNSLRIRVIRCYNLFNLLSPMGFLATRTCSAAQWEERAVAYRLWREVERVAPWLGGLLGEKCRHLGYCPERNWCPIILKYHGYSDELHRRHND